MDQSEIFDGTGPHVFYITYDSLPESVFPSGTMI